MKTKFGRALPLACVILLVMQLRLARADCPIEFGGSNLSSVSSACLENSDRVKCCRYINAFIAISVARYANSTGNLGVDSNLSTGCLGSLGQVLESSNVASDAAVSCGLGTKIPLNFECNGRTTVAEMIQSPNFGNVTGTCRGPLSVESSCRKCINAGITYLQHMSRTEDSLIFSICRDATFVVLASEVDTTAAIDLATCYFGVEGFDAPPSMDPAVQTPKMPLSPSVSPNSTSWESILPQRSHHRYHLTLIPAIAIVVTAVAIIVLGIMIFLIHRKTKELQYSKNPMKEIPDGPPTIRRFSYREMRKATDGFTTVIGEGGFGTVYKAKLSDGSLAAVKRVKNISKQGESDFCREMELFGRLHHRHLVSLKGFCIEKNERFLIYEYMENGSLKEHLHSSDGSMLSWRMRIQIAIDVANALEYLHFYCDPPLCHRDIKSSNILLDKKFVAKIADFGLAHASNYSSVSSEPVSANIRGTPGYMDPEYVVTQELTEKSDMYSFGVLLLELVTGRKAIQDSKNLVEWARLYMDSDARLPELADPRIRNSSDIDELKTIVTVVRSCTRREGKTRPSIKQVLWTLYEGLNLSHSGMEEGSKGKMRLNEVGGFSSMDCRWLPSSSSTSRSHCSRSFLLEANTP